MGVPELTGTAEQVVAVFGSFRPSPGEAEYTLAYEVGWQLAKSGFVVSNGGYGGTMEASSRGAKEAGGYTIGIITSFFPGLQANHWVDKVVTCGSLLDRLRELVLTADAYIVLRGGTGTLLELAAVWELTNKGAIRNKPIVIVGPHWESVRATLAHELSWEDLDGCAHLVETASSASEAVDLIRKRLDPEI